MPIADPTTARRYTALRWTTGNPSISCERVWADECANRIGHAGQRTPAGQLLTTVEYGRFERSLSGLTAFAAVVTCSEVYLEHYKASFGNKVMWSPILVTPPLVVAGIGGVFSKKWAKTALPITSGIFMLNGLAGECYHARGVARKPGVFALWSYNLPMGPPISALGLMAMVGGMGLLASVLRREK